MHISLSLSLLALLSFTQHEKIKFYIDTGQYFSIEKCISYFYEAHSCIKVVGKNISENVFATRAIRWHNTFIPSASSTVISVNATPFAG